MFKSVHMDIDRYLLCLVAVLILGKKYPTAGLMTPSLVISEDLKMKARIGKDEK